MIVAPYIPYLALCNIFLYSKMKFKLKGHHFDSVQEIQSESEMAHMRGRRAVSGVSLHKVITSKEMVAKLKLGTVLTYYRCCIETFFYHT